MGQFSGLQVLELASVLAGPSVGQFFAELGADVVKVENLTTGGDVTRSWKISGEQTDDRSAYFCSVNWGKRSIAIDLMHIDGRKVVQSLASRADVVVASYKPGDAEKLGVDFATLSKLNPKIIYGQITGYGSHNPRVGYDAIIQAEAGFMFMNGEPDGSSLKMPVALMDVIAGHHLKEALLLAMLEKANTGNGKFVEVSLIQAAVSSLVNQATNWLVAGKLPRKQGSMHPNIAPYGDLFKTKDNKELILAVGTDSQFEKLCRALGLDDIPTQVQYQSNAARVVNRNGLRNLLGAKIADINSAELISRLNDLNVPAAVVKTMEEVFEMPEARAMVVRNSDRSGLKTFGGNQHSDEKFIDAGVPGLGEHTISILSDAGYDGQAINKLLADKIVGTRK